MDFNWEYYKELNPDLYWSGIITPNDYKNHFIHHQKKENRKYRFEELFPDFDWEEYKRKNQGIHLNTKHACEYHYFSIGRNIIENTDVIPDINIKKNIQIELPVVKNNKEEHIQIVKHKPSFGIFLTGFGMPNLEIKKEILLKNLEIFKKWKDIYIMDLYIYIYNPKLSDCLKDILFKEYISNVEIIVKPGIVGEFIYQNVSLLYKKYDYTILCLDDIQLPDNFDLDKMLHVYNIEKLDILGLPLTLDSPHNHKFMLQNIDILRKGYTFRLTNFVELFFYFISTKNFPKYLQFFTNKTQWCWGLDIAIGCYGLKLGILECYPIKHYFKAASYNSSLPNPLVEFESTKRRLKTIKDKIILRKEKY